MVHRIIAGGRDVTYEYIRTTLQKKQEQLSELGEKSHEQAKRIEQLLHQEAQSKSDIKQREQTIEQQGKEIKGKNELLKVLSGIGIGGIAATLVNSSLPDVMSTQFLPDLTTNTQEVQVDVNIHPVQIVPEVGLTINDLQEIRDTLFEPVTVKEGQGYSQVLQEQLGNEIKELGLEPDSLELKGVYRLMDTFTKALESNSPSAADTNINHFDQGLPAGSKVYVPKNAFALQVILEKLETVKAPAQQK